MGYFRLVGTGAQAPGPIEKIARSATAAEVERSNLQRLCGRHGKVEVTVEGGRTISLGMLRRLAQDEALAGCGDGGIPKSGDTGPHRS